MNRRLVLLPVALALVSCDVPTFSEVRQAPVFPLARATFVIDDGHATDWTVKLPLFLAHGAVAVAAVPSSRRELTDQQLQDLQNVYGWEIADHGKTHRNEPTLTDDEMEEELHDSKVALENLGLRISMHVYPYGMYDQRVKDAVRKYYRAGIMAWGGANGLPLRDRFEVSRTIIDHHYLDSLRAQSMPARHGMFGPYNLKWYTSLVRRAQRRGSWLIFSIHEVSVEDTALLGRLIDYIHYRKVPIVTLSQGFDMGGALPLQNVPDTLTIPAETQD